jgi:hypothetical protein
MVAKPLSNSYCAEVRWLIKRLKCLEVLSVTLRLTKSIFLYLKNLSWVALIKESLAGVEII